MTVTPNWAPFAIVAGPADVYIAKYETAFPKVTEAPSESWTAIGKTEGGVNVQHGGTVQMITSDQTTGPIKAIRTDESLEISFSVVELTLEKYAKVLNGITVETDEEETLKKIVLHQGYAVTNFALLIRGYSPYGAFAAQYAVPQVVQTDQPQVSYTKSDKAVLSCTYSALEDINASADNERFGFLEAATE